jgi:uncharacterized metal-binding protein YceD (DUF177 family)
MTFAIPDYVDCGRLAAVGARITGEIAAARFVRGSGLHRLVEAVQVDLMFTLDDHRRVQVSGCLRGAIDTQCQRCLETVRLTVESTLDDETLDDAPAPESTAPANTSASFNLLAFAEDEFMLACPMIAHHPAGACRPPGGSEHLAGGTANPFDVLTTLRQNKR